MTVTNSISQAKICAADVSSHEPPKSIRRYAVPALEFILAAITGIALTIIIALMPLAG